MVSSALPSTLFPALDEYCWLGPGLVIPCSGVGHLLSRYLTEMSLTLCLELLVLLGSAYCDHLEQPPPVEFRARFPTPSQSFIFQPSSSIFSSFAVCCRCTFYSPEANIRCKITLLKDLRCGSYPSKINGMHTPPHTQNWKGTHQKVTSGLTAGIIYLLKFPMSNIPDV